jgi:hypothetical protein
MADAFSSTATVAGSSTTSIFTDYVVAEFQCAAIRARLLATEIESVRIALRGGLIDVDSAMSWMADIGALSLIAASSAISSPQDKKKE